TIRFYLENGVEFVLYINVTAELTSGDLSLPETDTDRAYLIVGSYIGLSTADDGAEIYYTLNGSDPRENGILYTGAILVSGTVFTIKSATLYDDVWGAVAERVFAVANASLVTLNLAATYNGSVQTIVATYPEDYTVKVLSGASAFTGAIHAGSYVLTLEIYYTGELIDSKEITFVIAKASVTVPIINGTAAKAGDLLSKIALSSAEDGIYEWVTPTTVLVKGENIVSWRFVPNYPNDYEGALSGTITVNAAAVDGGGDGGDDDNGAKIAIIVGSVVGGTALLAAAGYLAFVWLKKKKIFEKYSV
ncbi:MAG: chitobiase/beta-hexosaminidase C-terminal domain-containing protein, partial [Clostridiales bacterium]|nr:chitobiase/beta-hexosaminidase C-terminal domain-containing protein [Clostridiales bacterium]